MTPACVKCLALTALNGRAKGLHNNVSLLTNWKYVVRFECCEELSKNLDYNQIGVTTLGKLREKGINVDYTPKNNNPYHGDLHGGTIEDASKIFTPTQRNSWKKGGGK